MIKLREVFIVLTITILVVSCSSKQLTVPEFLKQNKDIKVLINSNMPLDENQDYAFPYGCDNGYTLTVVNEEKNFQKTVFVTNCDPLSLKEDFGINYEMFFVIQSSFSGVTLYKLRFKKL